MAFVGDPPSTSFQLWLDFLNEQHEAEEGRKDYFVQLSTEIHALHLLRHEGVVDLRHVFQSLPPEGADPEEDQGQMFLVMEYFPGMTLDALMNQRCRGPEEDAPSEGRGGSEGGGSPMLTALDV